MTTTKEVEEEEKKINNKFAIYLKAPNLILVKYTNRADSPWEGKKNAFYISILIGVLVVICSFTRIITFSSFNGCNFRFLRLGSSSFDWVYRMYVYAIYRMTIAK